MRSFGRTPSRPAGYLAAALAALALCLCQPPARAQQQWVTSGNNISNGNAGNVGVGTASPVGKVHVVDSVGTTATGDNAFRVESTAGTIGPTFRLKSAEGADYLMTATGSGNYGGAGNFRIYDYAGAATRLFIQGTTGYVGIGTTSPANGFHVNNDAGAQAIRVSGSGGAYVNFVDTAAAANQKLYQWRSESGLFRLTLLNDSALTFVQQNILVANSSGNVGIGTATPAAGARLDVSGNVNVSGGSLTISGDINAGGNINAKFQDVAEWVPSAKLLPAGTVVVLDASHNNQVTSSSRAYDTRVAGVVSPQPGITLGERGEGKALVATTGRVRVKVDASRAPIAVGDLLVTSDVEGMAMKSVPVDLGGVQIHRPGTIIGKALEPLEKGTGEILVLLSLQ